MLTVMCPNCRLRFPAPGCCNPGPHSVTNIGGGGGIMMQQQQQLSQSSNCVSNGAFYGGGYLLVPREYSSNVGGCFINAPTIIHGPTIIQQPGLNQQTTLVNKPSDSQIAENSPWNSVNVEDQKNPTILNNDSNINFLKSTRITDSNNRTDQNCHINTTCDLTGGTVTITTPTIQSGGCLIQTTDTGLIVQAPRIEIRPKLSGGGCFVQQQLSINDDDNTLIYRDGRVDNFLSGRLFGDASNNDRICLLPPSGCQELPGIRRLSVIQNGTTSENIHGDDRNDCWRHCNNYIDQQQQKQPQQQQQQPQQQQHHHSFCNSITEMKKRHSTCCCGNSSRDEETSCRSNRPLSSSTVHENIGNNEKPQTSDTSSSMEIRVNATVQLPGNIEHCTVNITATTGTNSDNVNTRPRNNFNGGGLVQFDANLTGVSNDTTQDRRDDAPTTPLSWLIPCPWQFDNQSQDKEINRLADIKRLLHTSGWYHEGLGWQQSETLLKNSPLGSWLLRDSSDSRFLFAVSVQTARGPTSVRVHYFLGRFRLDAEPRLSHNMPSFECPIKMLEHYVDYSNKIDEHRKEVWVDYSGQLYSQIYLTKPLVKEVQTLSHLARIVVNNNNIKNEYLPPPLKNYLAEYPYSL